MSYFASSIPVGGEADYIGRSESLPHRCGLGSLQCLCSSGGNQTDSGNSPITRDGQWHHVVGTYDGMHVRLYVDGSEIGSGTATTASIEYDLPSNRNLWVGAYHDSCHLPFTGLIDEVGVWNRALSAEEIDALSVGIGSLEWLPPIILPDWTLNENATLPIKFKLYDPVGDLICTGLAPTLQVNGQTVDVRFDSTECHYIANFRPTQSDGHTATVLRDGVELGSHDFLVVEAGKANGRGHGKN